MIRTSILALAALGLVACGQKGGNAAASAGGGAPGGAAAGGAAASGPDQTIAFADLPRPRAGLWKTTLDDGDGQPDVESHCYSGQMPNVGKMPPGCPDLTIKRTFTGDIVMDFDCKSKDITMSMHSVSRGDPQSHMTTDSVTNVTMEGHPQQTTKMHADMQYVGPCAPGQKPDDYSDQGNATG